MSSVRLRRTSSSTIGIAIAISAAATTKTRNTSTAPARGAGLLRERHQAQVHAVEHQLHAHQHHEHVAPDDDAEQAQREQRRRSAPTSICVLSMVPPSHFDHGQRGHDGGHQQHRHQFEVQPVVVQECDREAAARRRAVAAIRGGRPTDRAQP